MSINNPSQLILNPILSIAGEPLPESLIHTFKNYKSTPFETKSKEQLLSMLNKNNE